MKKCVCCGRETYHKVNEQTVCAQCDVDGSFEYHLKQQAAQQSVQADDCPSCAGSGRKEIGGMLLTCLACDGTGNRR